MRHKPFKILSLATALASLPGAAALIDPANATPAQEQLEKSTASTTRTAPYANAFASVNGDLLGFYVNTRADGTVVADHYSHSSHSSHSSHYSSR
jgi:hypothetical protein